MACQQWLITRRVITTTSAGSVYPESTESSSPWTDPGGSGVGEPHRILHLACSARGHFSSRKLSLDSQKGLHVKKRWETTDQVQSLLNHFPSPPPPPHTHTVFQTRRQNPEEVGWQPVRCRAETRTPVPTLIQHKRCWAHIRGTELL